MYLSRRVDRGRALRRLARVRRVEAPQIAKSGSVRGGCESKLISTRRVAGLLGLVALALIFAGNALTGSAGGEPEVGGPVAEYARELAANPPGMAFWAGAYLEVLGFVAFLFYFPALWAVLRRTAGELEWLAVAALGAGLVATAVKLASGPIAIVAYDRAESGLSPDVQTALLESNGWSFVLTFALDGAFLLAAGALVITTRVLPRWLGWSAIAFGVVNLLSILGGLDGPPAVLLFFLWLAVSSAYLIATARRHAAEL